MKRCSYKLLIILFVTIGCVGPHKISISDQDIKRENIGGIEISLNDYKGSCQLSYVNGSKNKVIDLQIPWPCDFHRLPNGNVRIKTYGDTSIVLIEYSRPHPDLPDDCETQLQAIKIANKRVHPSEYIETVAACPPFQWDEKVFMGLFEN